MMSQSKGCTLGEGGGQKLLWLETEVPREEPHRQQHDALHNDDGGIGPVHAAEYTAEVLAPVPQAQIEFRSPNGLNRPRLEFGQV